MVAVATFQPRLDDTALALLRDVAERILVDSYGESTPDEWSAGRRERFGARLAGRCWQEDVDGYAGVLLQSYGERLVVTLDEPAVFVFQERAYPGWGALCATSDIGAMAKWCADDRRWPLALSLVGDTPADALANLARGRLPLWVTLRDDELWFDVSHACD